jgi:hypothetical protein
MVTRVTNPQLTRGQGAARAVAAPRTRLNARFSISRGIPLRSRAGQAQWNLSVVDFVSGNFRAVGLSFHRQRTPKLRRVLP